MILPIMLDPLAILAPVLPGSRTAEGHPLPCAASLLSRGNFGGAVLPPPLGALGDPAVAKGVRKVIPSPAAMHPRLYAPLLSLGMSLAAALPSCRELEHIQQPIQYTLVHLAQ